MLAFINWCQNSLWAQFIRSGKWQYPSVEVLHLGGLVLVFGSILVLNLRIFGRVLKLASISEVSRAVAGVTLVGIVLQVLSGPLLFITSAVKFYQSGPFWTKTAFLIAALAYHFLYHRPLTFSAASSTRDANRRGGTTHGLATQLMVSAWISLFLWMGVVLAGMGIELLA